MDDKAMFDVLQPFMPMWCQKVLPAVFDQSLSYYELLCKVLQKYNELVVIVNAHSEKLEDHETRITTLETITKEIQQKLAELDTQVKQNTANIAALTERVNQHDEEIETIQAFIDGLANSTSEHGFEINQTANTISFDINGTVIPYLSAVDTLIKRGAQVMKGNFAGGSVMLGGFDTSVTAGRIYGFCVGVENGDLHYITFVSNTNANDANTGTISSWKSVEVLDISDITQSEGTEEYKTISQKVITDLLKKKLAADMGISNATVGGYLNIASVDANGRPLTYGWGTPGGSGGDVNVVQTTGQSTTDVMSQKATTDAINSVKTNADAGATANNNLAATVVYPTTAGGTDGKFVDKNGATITRAALLASLIGADGKNSVFAVKKTGSSEWQRITWYKASAGEGIYDFEWWEYDGTNAKCGVDRITMATTGLFAVSERSSKDLGGGTAGIVDYTDLGDCLYGEQIASTFRDLVLDGLSTPDTNSEVSGYLKIPKTVTTYQEGAEYLLGLGAFTATVPLYARSGTAVQHFEHVVFTPIKQYFLSGGIDYTRYFCYASLPFITDDNAVYVYHVTMEIDNINTTYKDHLSVTINYSYSEHT